MAQKFTVPISIRQLTSASSQGLSIRLDGETEDRIRIEAGGRILWGDGTSVTGMDINLYRSGADLLKTDDAFQAAGGVITLTTSGAPTATLGDGAIAIDTTNDTFYFRSNGTWQEVSGGGASVTVSDAAPSSPDPGNLWYESDTGSMFIYYDDGSTSQWVEVGGSSVVAMFTSDTAPSTPSNGDLWFETDTGKTYVYYDDGTSEQWVEVGAASGGTPASGPDGSIQFVTSNALDSSTDLYWDDANSRLGIGTNAPSTAVEVVGTVTATTFDGDLTGNATTASALQTGRTIELTGDVTGTTVFDGSANVTINASVTAEVSSIDNLTDVTITGAQNGELLIYDGTEWVNDTMPTSEPMGHEDRTASTISFNAGTREFSIAPVSGSHTVWCAGVRYVKTSTETVTLPSAADLYYIYYDTTGTLQYQTTYFTWHEDTPTAYVYWNGTDYLLFDERHGITLDWQTHEYLHRTRGAVIADGFGASNYVTTGDGSSDTHTQLDIADGTFFDEDLQIDISHSATPTANTFEQILQGAAEIPIIYLSGTTWTFDSATEHPLKLGSSLPTYNLDTSGTWSTPDLGNGTFGVTWIVATNILGKPIIGILGQEEYNNIGQAEAAEWSALYLDNFPAVEMRPLYKVAYEIKTSYTNTNSAAIRGVYDLRRYGAGSSSIPAFPVSDHGSLTGLSDDDHLQYLTEARHDAHDHSAAMSSVVIYDISNVSASSPTSGEFLKWDGTAWTSSDVTLGTETTGDYVQSLVAGTGVTLSNNTGEGATPTVEIGQDVGTTANVTFNTVNADLTGNVTGNASTASALQTARTINLGGDLSGSASFDGSSDITISATVSLDSVALGADTTGDYVESLVAGTGVTLTNNTGEGATPTVAIGQDVSTTANVTFATVTADLTGDVTGTMTAGNIQVAVTGNNEIDTTSGNLTLDSAGGTVAIDDNATIAGDLTLTSTDAGSSAGPIIDLYRDSASPASADYIGQIQFSGENDNNATEIYAKVTGKITDPTLGSEDGLIETAIKGGGTFTIVSRQRSDELQLLNGVGLSVDGDVVVGGSLTVNGNTTTVDTATLTVEDPLIILASGNNTTDSVDIGFYGLYDTSGSQDLYAGLFRDASDGKFRLFVDSQTAPTTTVDTAATGYTVATLVANIEGDVTGNLTGDVYAANGTSKILDNGTNGSDASFTGTVTGTVSDISNHAIGDLSDVDLTIVTPATGDILYYDGADWINQPWTIGNTTDVTITSATAGDFLKWNGTAWVNDAIDLGTDTTGDYVESLVAGTGVSLSNNSGEGATPTVYIGQDVGTNASVTFDHVTGTYGVTTITTTGVPTVSAPDGTIAVDTTNDTFYFISSGTWQEVSGGGASVTVSDTPPSTPDVGNLWFESDTGLTFIYYDDGNTSQWVEVGGAPGIKSTAADAAPTDAIQGDLWYKTDTGNTYIYYDDGTSAQWVEIGATGNNGVTVGTSAPAGPTVGELWYNTTLAVMYVWDGSSWLLAGGGGGASVTVSDTPPSSPDEGDMWFESDTGKLLVYYDSVWVEVGGTGGGGSSSSTITSSSTDAALLMMEIGP